MEALMREYASDSSDNDDSATPDDKSVNDSKKEMQLVKQVKDKAAALTFDSNDAYKIKSESKHNMKKQPASLKDAGDQGEILESDLKTSDKVKSEPVIDFFGLSNVECDEEPDNTGSESNVCNRVEMVNAQGRVIPVEIPQSEFWTDIKASEVQKLQSRKIEKQIQSNETITQRKRNFPDFEHKNTVFPDFKGPGLQSKQSSSSKIAENHARTSSLNQNTSIQHHSQARKLYFIHPKISPLLHNKRLACRIPSKQEWKCQGHGGAVNRVKWNVPSYSHLFATCSMDSMIKIWNIWSQLDPCVKILTHHNKAVRDVEWSQDGKTLLSCSYDRSAAVIDVEKGNSLCRFDHTSYVSCGKWHPTNPSLCVTGGHNQLQAWDIRTPDIPIRCFDYKDNFGQVQDILFAPDGSTFFSSSDLVSRDSADRNLMAWDFKTGVTLSNQIYQERYTISRLKLHPHDGNFLAQSNGNYIAIFSTTRPYKMNRQKRFEGHELLGYSLGFDNTPDGSTVVSGSSDGKLFCYNYQTGKQFRTINTDMDVVMDISFHPLLPSTLACCAWDGSVQVWK